MNPLRLFTLVLIIVLLLGDISWANAGVFRHTLAARSSIDPEEFGRAYHAARERKDIAGGLADIHSNAGDEQIVLDTNLNLFDRLRGIFYAIRNIHLRDVRLSAVEYVMERFTEIPREITGFRRKLAKAKKIVEFVAWSIRFFWNDIPLAYKIMEVSSDVSKGSLWMREGKRFEGYLSTTKLPQEEVDSVVIGLGASGAAVLNEFASVYQGDREKYADLRVVGLEIGDSPASGASGRNGGFVVSGKRLYAREYDIFYTKLEKRHPDWSREQLDREARRLTNALFQVMDKNSDILKEVVEKDKIQADYKREGWLLIADSPQTAKDMKRSVEMGREAGFQWEALSAAEIKERFGAEAEAFCDSNGQEIPVSGIFQPKSATVNPAQLVWELVDRALQKGRDESGRDNVIKIYTNTGATKIEDLPDGGFLVHTPRGTIRTKKIIDARDSYSPNPNIRPYHSQIHTFDMVPPKMRGEGISKAYFYMRGYNGLLTVGSDHSYSDEPGDESISTLIRLFVVYNVNRMFPGLRLHIINEGAGTMGETTDMKPIVGPSDEDGRWHDLMGYSGHGFGFIFAAARETVYNVLDIQGERIFLPEIFGPERFETAPIGQKILIVRKTLRGDLRFEGPSLSSEVKNTIRYYAEFTPMPPPSFSEQVRYILIDKNRIDKYEDVIGRVSSSWNVQFITDISQLPRDVPTNEITVMVDPEDASNTEWRKTQYKWFLPIIYTEKSFVLAAELAATSSTFEDTYVFKFVKGFYENLLGEELETSEVQAWFTSPWLLTTRIPMISETLELLRIATTQLDSAA